MLVPIVSSATAASLIAKKGNMKYGFAFAGENAYRADKIVYVKELVNTLAEEYEKVLGKM